MLVSSNAAPARRKDRHAFRSHWCRASPRARKASAAATLPQHAARPSVQTAGYVGPTQVGTEAPVRSSRPRHDVRRAGLRADQLRAVRARRRRAVGRGRCSTTTTRGRRARTPQYLGARARSRSRSTPATARSRSRSSTTAGRTLPGFAAGGRTLVVGEDGERYKIVVRNATTARFEIVASVDGLDVIDGKPADPNRRGYIVDPHDTLVIDGFRTSDARRRRVPVRPRRRLVRRPDLGRSQRRRRRARDLLRARRGVDAGRARAPRQRESVPVARLRMPPPE